MARAQSWTWAVSVLAGAVLVGTVCREAYADATPTRDDLLTLKSACDADYQQQLVALAQQLAQQDPPGPADEVRRWAIRRAPDRQYIFLNHSNAPEGEDAPTTTTAFQDLRNQHADRLWTLALQAKEAGQVELALQWLPEIVRENPQHAEARRILDKLGYPPAGKESPTPRVRPSRARHTELKWSPNRYWYVDSPHYQIVTNHSQQAGIDLAQKLELLHVAWRHLFLRYWLPEEQWSRIWEADSKGPRLQRQRLHRVVLFANRAEYLKHLRPTVSQVDITLGMYRDGNQTAYFYHDDEDRSATWRHEATHQLFHEIGQGGRDIGTKGNFWIVEGIAMYMESLRSFPGYLTVGGFDAPRLQYGRYRALSDKFYIPLSQLTVLSRDQLQTAENIRRLYSQSAGLTHCLMDYQQGIHRAALIDFVRLVYKQQDDETSLRRLTDMTLEDLDQQYLEFLQVRDGDLGFLPMEPVVHQLALGRTQVTDNGLTGLARQTQLTWLDLADNTVGDATVSQLTGLKQMKQLNLEGTKITDESLAVVGQMAQLEELDLSRTAVTDAGLGHLQGLTKLQTLWLTATAISDEGLAHLRPLRDLKTLELDGTQVTEAGRQNLRQALPHWTAP